MKQGRYGLDVVTELKIKGITEGRAITMLQTC